MFACTNCPWDIDDAFMRRFSRRIFIDLPTPKDAFILLIKQLGVEIELNQEQVIILKLKIIFTFNLDGSYN